MEQEATTWRLVTSRRGSPTGPEESHRDQGPSRSRMTVCLACLLTDISYLVSSLPSEGTEGSPIPSSTPTLSTFQSPHGSQSHISSHDFGSPPPPASFWAEPAKAQRAFLLVRALAGPPQAQIHANQTKKGFGFGTSWLWVLFVSVSQIPFLDSGKLDSVSEVGQYGSPWLALGTVSRQTCLQP